MWSYLLAAIGILGIYLAGKKSLWGWAIGFVAQFLWIVFALVTHQYGFIISAVAYGAVYAINWRKWRTESDSSGADSVKLIPADFNNTESGAVCVSRRRLPVELVAVRSGDPVILYDDVEDLWLLSAVRWTDDKKILVDPFMRVTVRLPHTRKTDNGTQRIPLSVSANAVRLEVNQDHRKGK